MSTDRHVIEAHSVAEAYLYLKVTPCPRCLRGLLQPTIDLTRDADGWRLSCECRHCQSPVTLQFRIDPPPTRASAQSKEINATPAPSRAIDLVGWLNLFQQIVTIAARTEDRVEGRDLALEAGACLDEALKFYEDGNDMPPAGAFFTETSQAAFRNHPQRFLRSTWLQRRMNLPKAAATSRRDPAPTKPKRRRWWPFGARDGDA